MQRLRAGNAPLLGKLREPLPVASRIQPLSSGEECSCIVVERIRDANHSSLFSRRELSRRKNNKMKKVAIAEKERGIMGMEF